MAKFQVSNKYHFITNWRVEGTTEEVYEILSKPKGLERWWPSVYLEVQELEPGDEHGVGKVVKLLTKGWLPYTLRWQFRVTEACKPHGFKLEAWGDFNGRGIWTFAQQGAQVNITYDWEIHADKPILRYFSWLLKPIFSANHRWAMAKGEASLKLELKRRSLPEKANLIESPPGPTFPHSLRYKKITYSQDDCKK
jgi:hypothetical protein